jgi:glucose-1-phosphate thymidylyltransferase
MKGIVLAGGKGTRLYPVTQSLSKHLLPIYDKPMIYYPISVLMLLGIRDILLICDNKDLNAYQELFGDGGTIGLNISYKIQESPNGIAEAFLIGEDFIDNQSVCLILGDNIFYGQDYIRQLKEKINKVDGALITAYYVNNPSDFGVVHFNSDMKVLSIEEKPLKPKSNYAVPGLYFYNHKVVELVKTIRPSLRGELEITSLNNKYLEQGELSIHVLGRGVAWLDTGSADSLRIASEFVHLIQSRQGLYIACLEEIAWRMGYISKSQLKELGKINSTSDYGKYISSIGSQLESDPRE